MAAITISDGASHNHDEYVGTRLAGENFTLTNRSTLVVDSSPHLFGTCLGDITLTAGTLHIDGRYVREVAYSSGSGAIPAVGDAVTWTGGAGKVIGLDSGNNAAGVMTITRQSGVDPTGTITDGTWSATVDSSKVGFLRIHGTDQDWGSVDAQSSLVINGDWYEVYVGDGTDNQTFELPHTGHQFALWVETGNATGVFEIWHRIVPNAQAVFWANINQFGGNFETGFVFDQIHGDATVTFGTSTAGGVVPNGARVRIPNVLVETVTTIDQVTPTIGTSASSRIGLVSPNTNQNISIDHLNASGATIALVGTNSVNVSDSCWGWMQTNFVNKVNANVLIDNCAMVNGGLGVALLDVVPASVLITDNIGGVEIRDSVIMAGTNGSNTSALALTTMANLQLTGRNKIVSNQQDENTMATLRGAVSPNVYAETLITLGGAVYISTGCVNWEIDELIFGSPPGRGATEFSFQALNASGSQNIKINSGRFVDSTENNSRSAGSLYSLTDCDSVTIRNHGEVDAKLDGKSRMTSIVVFSGITTNVLLQRLFFTNLNTTAPFSMLNSCADITVENCSADYNDEIENDATRVLFKGVHGGSGGPEAATGVEGDLVNCLASCFYDLFTSDTTGSLGLIFNDRGQKHLNDIEITAGAPIWNGLGDLLMRSGDQLVYTWPYSIRGHTGFQNQALRMTGAAVANKTVEYSVDTGAGWSAWTACTGANLSAETISPAGFKFRVRITATGAINTNGFDVRTTTTIAGQKANLYPLDVSTVTFTGLPTGCDIVILAAGTSTILDQRDSIAGTSYAYEYEGTPTIDVGFIKPGYQLQYIRNLSLGASDSTIPVTLTPDRNYQ